MDEDLKNFLQGMEQRLDSKLAAMDPKLAAMDSNLAAMDPKLAAMDSKLAAMDFKLAAMEQRLDAKLIDLDHSLVEKMRGMQTELLRGFESFSTGQGIRLRKLEADQSNLDASVRGRVDILEARLMQIEIRLGLSLLGPPPQ